MGIQHHLAGPLRVRMLLTQGDLSQQYGCRAATTASGQGPRVTQVGEVDRLPDSAWIPFASTGPLALSFSSHGLFRPRYLSSNQAGPGLRRLENRQHVDHESLVSSELTSK